MSQELWRGAIAFDNPFQSTIFLSRPQFLSCDSLGCRAEVSMQSPQSGTPGVGPIAMHCPVLTHLAGGYHLQALLVCPNATSGTQVSLVEGTPVRGRVEVRWGVALRTLSHNHHDGRWPALERPRPQSI